ncbi:aminotransferase class III-fold pyridoxal phosphate-dependent enzyme, partial [Klebsiella pneumoniae]
NPAVVEAVSSQIATLNTHTRYMSENILNYSEQLLNTFEPELGHVMYTCTGSEAVDLSLRIAKFYTGGTGIIVTDYAYHGITTTVAA